MTKYLLYNFFLLFRDSLDVHLSRSEYDILLDLTEIGSSLQMYCRLVDDISVLLQSNFSNVRKVLNVMAFHYPDMTLNVQISFGYSRFLDIHLYNICGVEYENDSYGLCRVLAYKELSPFSYTPACSNIHDGYKHAVVPVSLHRIHTRNTFQADIHNHLSFMHKILQSRLQNPKEVKRKSRKFFAKKVSTSRSRGCSKVDFKDCCIVKFDKVTRRHVFLRSLLRRSMVQLRLMHKSGRCLGSILCPKRKVINVLSNILSDRVL